VADNRFKQLVHYVCSRCADDPSKLGAVKLNKALWLSDLRSYYATGHAITNARYVKRQFGPVPAPIVQVLRELELEHVLDVKTTMFHGRPKKEFIVHRRITGDFLSAAEKKIVDNTIESVTQDHTAVSISDMSHDHIWHAAKDGEELPHFTAFANPGQITDEDRDWARMKLAGEI
jgi:hypothetical protein